MQSLAILYPNRTLPKSHLCQFCRYFSKRLDKKVNHYEVLGVDRKAHASEIKSAYYKLSMAHHPDKSKEPDSLRRFQQINDAYETLGNYEGRRSYDRTVYSGKTWDKDEVHQNPQRKSEKDWTTVSEEDYTQFYKRRKEEFRRKKDRSETQGTYRPPVGQTSAYNYDAFYAVHYLDSANKRKDLKAKQSHRDQRLSEVREKHDLSFVMVFVVVLMVLVTFFKEDYVPEAFLRNKFDLKERDDDGLVASERTESKTPNSLDPSSKA